MKFLFASDSFKGTLTSRDTITLLTEAAAEVFGKERCECHGVLVADGGEGTADAILEACGGEKIPLRVHDPLMREIPSFYGKIDDHTAILEMAAASGLSLLCSEECDPMETTTYGTGELIRDALQKGFTDLFIAIGGSATNDGGMGCMRALGVRFLDAEGNELEGKGADLEKVRRIDDSGLLPELRSGLDPEVNPELRTGAYSGMPPASYPGIKSMPCPGMDFASYPGIESGSCPEMDSGKYTRIESEQHPGLNSESHFPTSRIKINVICDVTNPLCGKQGATYTFGSQKGASSAKLEQLERGMQNYRGVLRQKYGKDADTMPGSGAAGGLGAALMIFLNGVRRPGIETVLDLIHFDELLQDCSLVITGEGKTDEQTSFGKAVQGIGRRCKKYNVPVIALSGSMGSGGERILMDGVDSVMVTVKAPATLEETLRDARENYADAARRMFRMIRVGMQIADQN